jgi:2-C-methyl-D-erythritol 2,4-cyclodiphosphate synthase
MIRIGIGYDLHRLEEGRRLILAGVTIPHDKGLLGHSDGDVLAHAVTDALLGAASLGNIGQRFPDTSAKFKGADSLALLMQVVELVHRSGFGIVNVDANIIAELPKLNPHIDMMRTRLAECLGIQVQNVSVKPKTNEQVGPEGRHDAISAQAVVLIEQRRP